MPGSTDLTQYTDEELEAALAEPPEPDLSQFSTEELEASLSFDERFAVPRSVVGPMDRYTPAAVRELDADTRRTARRVEQERTDYLNNQIQSQVPNFNPEADWQGGNQLDLAYSTDFVQAQRKWRDEHPEGELVQVQTDDGPRILGRTNAEQDFAMLPEGWQTAANVLSGRTAGAVAGSVLAPRGYIFPAMVVAGLSSLGGAIQYHIERSRGYDDREASQAYVAALGDGGIDGATEAGIRGVLRVGGVRSFDTAAQLQDDLRIIRAAQRLGFPTVAEGQLGGQFWRGLYAQTSNVSETATRRIQQVRQEALDNLDNIRENPQFAASMSDEQVSTMVLAYTEDLQNAVFRGARGRTPAEAGQALMRAVENYKAASRVGMDHAYNVARNLADENTSFNIRATQRAIDNQLRPVWTRLQQGRNPDGTFSEQALQEISTHLGMPRQFIDDLVLVKSLDPNVRVVRGPDGSVTDAFEQMTSLRSRFFDAMSDPNSPPQVRQMARTVWGRLTTDLENIVTGNPQLTEAWRTASAMYRVRAQNLESGIVAHLLRTEGADNVVRRFFSPGSSPPYEQVRTLWQIATPHERRQLTNAVKSDFLNGEESAATLLRRLDGYENTAPEVLNTILSRRDAAALRDALLARQEFEGSAAFRALTREADRAQRGINFIRNGSNAEFQQYMNTVGREEGANALRYSIFTDISEHARVGLDNGGLGLDGNLLADRAAYWLGEQRAGRIPREVFNEEFARRLADFQVYGHSMDLASDVGGAMQAGSIRGPATRAATDIVTQGMPGVQGLFHKVIRPLYSNAVMNWMLSRPASVWSRVPAEAGVDSLIAGAGMTYASIERQIERDEARRTAEIERRTPRD